MNFNYEHKMICESNALVRAKIIEWTRIFLAKDKHPSQIDKSIDILLTSIQVDKVIRMYNECVKSGSETGRSLEKLSNVNEFAISDTTYTNLVLYLAAHWRTTKIEKAKRTMFRAIENELKNMNTMIIEDDLHYRLSRLAKTFRLSEVEITAVLFTHARGVDCDFKSLSGDNTRHNKNEKLVIERFAILNELSLSKVAAIFKRNGKLRKFEIIDSSWELDSRIEDFVNGLLEEELESTYFREFTGKALPLSSHEINKKDLSIIETIVSRRKKNSGVHILLYGTPGTGKTEFCRSIAQSLGLRLFELRSVFEKSDFFNKPNRFAAYYAAQNCVPAENSIVLIDESDEMLNAKSGGSIFSLGKTRNAEKNLINEALDNSKMVNFWISNYAAEIDESTKRRFDYSVEFRSFNSRQRVGIWTNALNKYGFDWTGRHIESLAENFEINPGGVEVVLRNYEKLLKKEQSDETLKLLIERHQKLMGISNYASKISEPVGYYSIEGLNIKGNGDIEEAMEIISGFSSFMRSEEFKNSDIKNMNALFYGPPGTGKTEFVKFIAKKIGCDLLMRKGSDFLGMYVGQTEQNIKDVFRDAEERGAILFIDEADGLFFDRRNAVRGFEVSKVNEFLSGMENFSGIFICATNFKDKFDFASIRRFNIKLEFDYLTNEGKKIFFEKCLMSVSGEPLTPDEEFKLNALDGLTPGDFKVVKHKYAFAASRKKSNESLLNALTEENSHKTSKLTNKIGFKH